MTKDKPTVLTIAGSDSGGGAGIQGDVKTLEAFHVYGLTVLTSITAQNTQGVFQVFDLPPRLVAAQLKAVAEDIPIQAAKTGLLGGVDTIETVAAHIKEFGIRNLVVDPVMRATSGDLLMTPQAQQALIHHLLPLCRIVTPNLPEATELSGVSIRNLPAMKEAARAIVGLGAPAVLIKGGHRAPAGKFDPLISLQARQVRIETNPHDQHPKVSNGDIRSAQGARQRVVDLFFDGRDFYEFGADWVDIPGGVHGTGCALSAAIAAGLAQGLSSLEAIRQAKTYITEAIQRHYRVGHGQPVLDHSWRCFNPRGE